MHSLSGCPDPVLPAPRPLALILAGLTAPVWGIAGLALGLTFLVSGILVPALSAPLTLVLAPLILACRSWTPWLLDPESWLCWCWLRWPLLCWRWMSRPRRIRSRVFLPANVAQGEWRLVSMRSVWGGRE